MEPVNVENLERLLQGIWSGELEHDQGYYFCGTACCLAGWDVALNAREQPEKPEDRFKWFGDETTDAYADPRCWSLRNNNLTSREADLLFHSKTTKRLHELVLQAFKAGRRALIATLTTHFWFNT